MISSCRIDYLWAADDSPLIGVLTEMDMTVLDLILVFVGGVIGSLGSSGVLMYVIKKRDVTNEIVEKNNRIGEAVDLIIEANIVLVEALREKQVLNGEGKKIREMLEKYLRKNTRNGFIVDDD